MVTKFMTVCSNCGQERELVDGTLCQECLSYWRDCQREELDKEDEYVIVTREMARDAGDLRLEGQLWKWR